MTVTSTINGKRTAAPQSSFTPWKDPNAHPIVRFENVTKRFGNFVAVDNITLDIYEREFFALLGPSGCGKTTLLRMLAGFETPTEGRILVEGKDITTLAPYERQNINMMFQSYALFPHMTVERNIGFGLRQEGMPADQIAERVNEAIQLVELGQFANRKPHQLSGGQQQRVALARAIAKKPRIMLLDEPLGALDKRLRNQAQFELMRIQEKTGTTFIIVTHDQEEAMTVASRIAVMNHGVLMQVSIPGDIYESPNSRYVAEFIGEVNILEGRVVGISDGIVELALGKNHIRLVKGNTVFTSKLIDGTFPDYARVIPQNNDKELRVSNAEFIAAVDRVSTIASERGRAVKLAIEKDRLTLSVNNPEGGSATEELDVTYDAEPLEIGFNARYLLDIAAQLESDQAVFRLADPGSPTMVRDSGDDSALYVLMPMRV